MSNITSVLKLIVLADDPENAEIMSELSCLPGTFDVLGIAYSVPDLIKLADQKTPDVLLVDYFFWHEPAADGLDKFVRSFENIPIVLLSNFPALLEDIFHPQKSKGLLSICRQPNSLDEYKIVSDELLRAYEHAQSRARRA
ncbi:MAG TPA: hypothetical protein VM187_09380 [Niastella sp.]|nr:hypothetical protein [Niastella sp.]